MLDSVHHLASFGEELLAVTSSKSNSHLSTSWNFLAAAFSSRPTLFSNSSLFSELPFPASSGSGPKLSSGSTSPSFSLSEVARACAPYVRLEAGCFPLAAPLAFRGALRGAGVLRGTVDLRLRARIVRCESSSSPDASPETSTSSSELGISKGSRAWRRRRRGRSDWSCAVEKVLGGGACLFGFGLGFVATTAGRFGECVSDGGEEIGESCVIGGGDLPRKGRRPRGGARCTGRAGSGLDGRELLLRGGAMVSLKSSGVTERPSIDGIKW